MAIKNLFVDTKFSAYIVNQKLSISHLFLSNIDGIYFTWRIIKRNCKQYHIITLFVKIVDLFFYEGKKNRVTSKNFISS
jgi:hypothetical protein